MLDFRVIFFLFFLAFMFICIGKNCIILVFFKKMFIYGFNILKNKIKRNVILYVILINSFFLKNIF